MKVYKTSKTSSVLEFHKVHGSLDKFRAVVRKITEAISHIETELVKSKSTPTSSGRPI